MLSVSLLAAYSLKHTEVGKHANVEMEQPQNVITVPVLRGTLKRKIFNIIGQLL